MSSHAVTWVLANSEARGNDRIVLLAIADDADSTGGNAYPSQRRIAFHARVSRTTVKRSIIRLEGAGELLVKRPDKQGRGRFNRYVVVAGRNPDELATALGWPLPTLDVELVQEWKRAAQETLDEGPPEMDDSPISIIGKGSHFGPLSEPRKDQKGSTEPAVSRVKGPEGVHLGGPDPLTGKPDPRAHARDDIIGQPPNPETTHERLAELDKPVTRSARVAAQIQAARETILRVENGEDPEPPSKVVDVVDPEVF